MRTKLRIIAVGASLGLLTAIGHAAILGGAHDFTTQSPGSTTFKWGGATLGTPGATYVNPCQVCHIPHKAPDAGAVNLTGAPLWNHAASLNQSYVTYDKGNSATFNALGLTATLGSSVACLSCHDGSVAVNQSYGTLVPNANGTPTGAVAYYAPTFAIEASTPATVKFAPVTAGQNLGRNDLTHMHPIGVSYAEAVSVDTTLQPLPASGTVFAQMLKGPKQSVECASCHDIHGAIGASGTVSHELIVDLNNAQLCSTCHKQ